jgi:N utilization substance protein B
MQHKKTPRHLARSLAVQGIYSIKLNNCLVTEIEAFLNDNNAALYQQADYALMHQLIEETLAKFDSNLDNYLPYLNREISEINLTEKVILAIAAHEILYSPSVPATVIINEAVELAKLYGAEESYKFINGLVDKLAKQVRAQEQENYPDTKKRLKSSTK